MNPRALIHSALFAAAVIFVGSAAVVRALPYAPPVGAELRNGAALRSFESHYDAVFPMRAFGISLWAAVQYVVFREGRTGVVVGSDDWLYTDEEFRGWPRADETVRSNLEWIADVDRRLARQGTSLIVALVPAKARLYPEFRRSAGVAPVHRDLYERARAGLLGLGVTTPDLFAALATCKSRGDVFLRTDTHWTPAGARCAAATIGATATRLGRRTGEPQAFVTSHAGRRRHVGDLVRFLPLDPYFADLLPAPDIIDVATTRAAEPADLLVDAPPPQAVLIGTSYSADPAWNFDGALREQLREDVLNLADRGEGPFAPMRAWLAAPVGTRAPRLLIWEIPERYLPMPPATNPHPTPDGGTTT